MKLAHSVQIETFIKANDTPARAEDALAHVVPVPVAELRAAQWRWHPERPRTKIYELPKRGITLIESVTPGDEGSITVLQYKFTKQRDTAAFLERLNALPHDELAVLRADIEGCLGTLPMNLCGPAASAAFRTVLAV